MSRELESNSLRLESALASWERWPANLAYKPKVIKKLSKGLTNLSYVISSATCDGNDQRFCLRINNPQSIELGINREHESTILKALQNKSFAPNLVFENSLLNFSVFDYYEGRSWTTADFLNDNQFTELESIIETFQSIEVPLSHMNYAGHLNNYFTQLQTKSPEKAKRFEKKLNTFLSEFEKISSKENTTVLCHHDLNPENILETANGLIILDWEYAGLGMPGFDKRFTNHYRNQSFNQIESLQNGDLIDQLIFWLLTLWNEVSND